jgi:hypothetical protein
MERVPYQVWKAAKVAVIAPATTPSALLSQSVWMQVAPEQCGGVAALLHAPRYGWIGQQSSSGFSDRPPAILGQIHFETGFELPSSWLNLPCYGLNRNRNILDFMRWPQIDLGAQDLNGIQRPKSFQKNSWK